MRSIIFGSFTILLNFKKLRKPKLTGENTSKKLKLILISSLFKNLIKVYFFINYFSCSKIIFYKNLQSSQIKFLTDAKNDKMLKIEETVFLVVKDLR